MIVSSYNGIACETKSDQTTSPKNTKHENKIGWEHLNSKTKTFKHKIPKQLEFVGFSLITLLEPVST